MIISDLKNPCEISPKDIIQAICKPKAFPFFYCLLLCITYMAGRFEINLKFYKKYSASNSPLMQHQQAAL